MILSKEPWSGMFFCIPDLWVIRSQAGRGSFPRRISSSVQAGYDLAPREENIQEMRSQSSSHVHKLQMKTAHLEREYGTRQREAWSGVKGNVTQLSG